MEWENAMARNWSRALLGLGLAATLSASGLRCAPQSEDGVTPADDARVAGASGLAGLVEIPDPRSGTNPAFRAGNPAPPATGQSVADSDFGTSQRRMTQSEQVRHEYSRHDPFNATRSLVLLLDIRQGDWRVYRTQNVPYDQPTNLVRSVDLEEPRWDPEQPNRLWGTRDFRIETLDAGSGATSIVKDFAQDPAVAPILAQHPDLYRITMKDEGESSIDKRYWAFLLQGSTDDYRAQYILSWDREENRVLGLRAVPREQSDIDWAGMSPRGNWVLIGGSENNASPLTGLVMANRELTDFHRLDWATAHADVALDSAGGEAIVMQNVRTDFIDLIPLDTATQPILVSGGRYEGTNRTPLVRLDYSSSPTGLGSGVHISCNVPGFCVVSTYIEPGVPEQNWLDRKIILTKLDRTSPRAFYLAKVHGTRDAYWEETQATITQDGSRVVWATNWGLHVGAERVWLMELAMPAGWQAALN
jgi:hypothetical protein